jgi:hypothetical protein
MAPPGPIATATGRSTDAEGGGPPSPELAAAPVPINVVMVPSDAILRTRLLPESHTKKSLVFGSAIAHSGPLKSARVACPESPLNASTPVPANTSI